jgi:hypothetical protein
MRHLRAAAVAGAALAVLGAGLTAQAQAPRRDIVFDVANSMGMLRGLQQDDSILSLEYWATGTMTMGAQKYEISKYRMSLNYSVPGMRVDLTRKAAGGAEQRQIHVVAGNFAWNETEPGVGPTPAQNTLRERLVMLWTTPFGAVKAARLAGANLKVTDQGGGRTVLTFPLPAPVNDVTATVTVSTDKSLFPNPPANQGKGLVGTYIERVSTTGGVVSESSYSEYGDWNWDDYKSDAFTPKRASRKFGETTLELTTTNTNTYNPYVVMPVPEITKK